MHNPKKRQNCTAHNQIRPVYYLKARTWSTLIAINKLMLSCWNKTVSHNVSSPLSWSWLWYRDLSTTIGMLYNVYSRNIFVRHIDWGQLSAALERKETISVLFFFFTETWVVLYFNTKTLCDNSLRHIFILNGASSSVTTVLYRVLHHGFFVGLMLLC